MVSITCIVSLTLHCAVSVSASAFGVACEAMAYAMWLRPMAYTVWSRPYALHSVAKALSSISSFTLAESLTLFARSAKPSVDTVSCHMLSVRSPAVKLLNRQIGGHAEQ